MTISPDDLQKIAQLAYLDLDVDHSAALNKEVNEIMNFIDHLRTVDTANTTPLFHSLAVHQRLRPDTISEESCVAELEALAPLFEDDLYLVPQVIEQAK